MFLVMGITGKVGGDRGRAELTPLERDVEVARWIELTAAKVLQIETPSGGHQPTFKGIRAAERELGIEATDAHRTVKVASLAEEAKEAGGGWPLDKVEKLMGWAN